MKTTRLFLLATALVLGMVSMTGAQTTYTLNPAGSFGSRGDGSIQPGDVIGTNPQSGNSVAVSAVLLNGVVYGVQPGDPASATNGFNMRGIGVDPVTGNVLLVDTHSGSGGSPNISTNAAIYVLDKNSGNIIGALNTNGIVGGSYTHVVVGVADDGVVYVANQATTSGTIGFKIYRWATADTNNPSFGQPPIVAFTNTLTPSDRVGETIDVRGSGTNTQIIASSAVTTSPASGGTNVYLFTTTDGTNFTAHRIFFPGITTPMFGDGVAFGPSNTFFCKQVGQPLTFASYDPTTFAGTIISQFSASSTSGSDPLLNLAGITVDNTRGLLAALEEVGGTAAAGPGRVWLYAIPNPTNQAPAILSSRTYSFNDTKATATMGYLRFGNGKLYANVVNNGLLVSTVDAISMPVPSFTLPPDAVGLQPRVTDLPASTRIATNQTAHFEVFATPNVTSYQWYSNNVPIPGANTYFYNIPNVLASFSGSVYKVIAGNAAGSTESVHSTLTVVSPGNFFHPQLLWSALATNDLTTFISTSGGTSTPTERSIAYNALSNQLLVVRSPAAFSSMRVFVINADTGALQYTLKTNGIVSSTTLNLCGIGVADDGAVYAATVGDSVVGGSDQTFKVYRWADTGSNTLPQLIFGTNSSAANANMVGDLVGAQFFRFGDVMAVHGSGVNTEIVMDSVSPTKYAGILRPTDGTMTNWLETGYLLQNITGSYGFQNAYGVGIGRSIQFGPTLTNVFGSVLPSFWEKRYFASGSPLSAMSYNAGGGLAALDFANTSSPLNTNGPLAVNFTLNLAAAVNFSGAPGTSTTTPDTLDYYDMSDPTQAVLLSRQVLPGANTGGGHFNNANAIAEVVFGASAVTGTNYLFAFNANNGISAYFLSGGVTPAPKFIAQPGNLRVLQNSTASLNVQLDQVATIQWFKGTNPAVNTGITGGTYTITNAQFTDAGPYFVIANNVNGSVTSQVAQVTVLSAAADYSLTQSWAATPGNTNLYPYVTTNGGPNTPTERTFAYNAASNQLLVVSLPVNTHNYNIYVVDGNTGTNLYTLNTTGVVNEGPSEVSGSNPIDLDAIGVADDGAVYVASETPNASGGAFADSTKMMHVFRWPNSGPSATPTLVYQGDPSSPAPGLNLRWGDVMSVRGSGTNTQLILNSQDGQFAAILVPTDSSMTLFTNFWFADSSGGGSIGRSIQFGGGNSFYEKRKGATLVVSTFNTNTQTTAGIGTVPSTGSLGGVFYDTNHSLAMGVDFIGSATAPLKPDAVALYDVSDPTTPSLINEYNFPINQVANVNFICQSVISGLRAYALDGNNGMVGFYINPPPNSLVLTVTPAGTNVNVSWGSTLAILQGSPSLSPTSWADLTSVGQTNSLQPAIGNKFYRLIVRR